MEENLSTLQAYFMVYHDLDLNEDKILDIIHNVRKYDSVKKDSLFGVLDIVSEVFCVSVNDIKSKSRKYPLPDARKCFCHLSNLFYYGLPDKKVGEYINIDRTTVFACVSKSLVLQESDRTYNLLLSECYSILRKTKH